MILEISFTFLMMMGRFIVSMNSYMRHNDNIAILFNSISYRETELVNLLVFGCVK